MSKVKLFDKPECPFCWRVRLALYAQGRPYVSMDRSDPQVSAEWERLSPQKTVPVLVDDDLVLTDSSIILEYLEDSRGGLLPQGARERARVREIVRYADAVLGVAIREVIFEKREKPEAEWDGLRIAAGTEGFIKALPWLERRISEREYFSDDYSFAECALTPRFALAEAYGLPIPERFTELSAWFKRMVARPGFKETAPPRVLAAVGGVGSSSR